MNDLHGETAEVHRWNYYSYKAWDAEYFVNERVPHEAIWLNKLNIPSDFFSNIAEDKSCIPFLEMISEMFGNKGYPLDQNVLDKIKKFEEEMILSNKIKKFKGIDKKKSVKRPSNTISPKQRNTILQRDSYKCIFCGATSEYNKLEVNHIIPKSLIRKLNLESKLEFESYNLCTTCFSCNRGKSDHLSVVDINYYIKKI